MGTKLSPLTHSLTPSTTRSFNHSLIQPLTHLPPLFLLRYTFMDDNLPEWFADYEKKHLRTALPISQERINYYKERQKQIDARPIKKIVEAKARKQRKVSLILSSIILTLIENDMNSRCRFEEGK